MSLENPFFKKETPEPQKPQKAETENKKEKDINNKDLGRKEFDFKSFFYVNEGLLAWLERKERNSFREGGKPLSEKDKNRLYELRRKYDEKVKGIPIAGKNYTERELEELKKIKEKYQKQMEEYIEQEEAKRDFYKKIVDYIDNKYK